MSLTTLKDILVSARAKVATIATSREPTEYFLEHTTNQPFEKSPLSKRDGFEVVSRNEEQTQGFGLTGAREWQAEMVVKVGSAPFSVDKTRQNWLAEDIERITDLLESHTWPTGTMLVLFQGLETDRNDPNWWITNINFKVVWVGALRTS